MSARRLATFVVLLAAGTTGSVHALTYPSASAPCNTTFVACVEGAPANAVIEIAGNDSALSGATITRNVTIRSIDGRRAQFRPRARFQIMQTSPTQPLVVTLEGFDMTDGSIYAMSSGDAERLSITVRDVRFEGLHAAELSFSEPIFVSHSSPEQLDVAIRDCEFHAVQNDFSPGFAGPQSLVRVQTFGDGDQATVAITGNRFEAVANSPLADEAAVFIVSARTMGTTSLTVEGNTFALKNFVKAIHVASNGTNNRVLVASNAIHARRAGEMAAATGVLISGAAAINLGVVNNTIVDTALAVDGGDARFGAIYNNVLAWNATALALAPALFRGHNLYFANGSNGTMPASGDVTADPLFVSRQQPRLRSGSPAIDAGEPLPGARSAAALPESPTGLVALLTAPIDVDGLRRRKLAEVDLGAYEFGDRSLRVRAMSTSGANVTIDDAASNGAADAVIGVSRIDIVDRFETIDATDKPISTSYAVDSGRWRVHNDLEASFVPRSEFSVLIPAPGEGAFEHVATVANTPGSYTRFDDSTGINTSAATKFVMITPTRGWQNNGVFNAHPAVATMAFATFWYALNMDGGDMPIGARFNVYSQPRTRNAFVHVSSAASLVGPMTQLDHPRLNDQPCAAVYANLGLGRKIATVYDRFVGRWALRYDDGLGPVTSGTEFFVLVDPAGVQNCNAPPFPDSIFASSFDNKPM